MSQPARWLWGLMPLALLCAAANVALDKAVERDVARRAEMAVQSSVGVVPGPRPVFAQVSGRDVTMGGEVLSADGAAKAMARLRGEFGVRRALGGLSQAVAQKPYSWFASRQPDAVTIGGFVPDIEVADANVAAVRAALPDARVDDRQSVAFGAPDGFAAMTRAMIAELPKLATGRIALDDKRFCIEGTARTPEGFLALESAAAHPAGSGFSAVPCGLQPPMVSPYRLSLEKSASGAVSIRGSYPDEEAHQKMLAAVRASVPPPIAIADRTMPGSGAPAAFLDKISRATRDLARLPTGKAEIEGDLYTLSGEGPGDYATCQAFKLQVAQQDGPDSVAQLSVECPPAPPPEPVMPLVPDMPALVLDDVLPKSAPQVAVSAAGEQQAAAPLAAVPLALWSAERSQERLVLKGALPDEASRAAIRADAARLFPGLTIDDGMTTGGGSPSDAARDSASFALNALVILRNGTVSIREGALSVSGSVADAAAWQSLQQMLSVGGPDGLKLAQEAQAVTVKPYELSLSADRGGVRMSGHLPDEAARGALKGVAAQAQPAGKVDDETVLVPGAPSGFVDAAKTALADVLRLDIGSATLIDDKIAIRGLTCRDLIASEVETSAKTGLPSNFDASVAVSPRQTGCVLGPPASCQNDLDGLTKQNPVLFAQGTAAVALDPTTERVMTAAATILKRCPAAHVTIEGHTNRDGEWRGFDNRELSLRRAQRVRDELERRGIDPAGLEVKGYGTARPLLPHGAPQSREMNRRVQFTIAK